MAHLEIEIKSLLGEESNKDILITKMFELDPNTIMTGKNSQLNHYFEGGEISRLEDLITPYLNEEQKNKLSKLVTEGKDFSVRTRQKDQEVLLVVKASMDGGTSSNTITRLEFEEVINMPLTELDELVIRAGYKYQAKWSRDREEYSYKGISVCLDKNAGYGHIAEFESLTNHVDNVQEVKDNLYKIMNDLGVAELPQERLARMFAFYNEHWPEYYGTDKVFNIE